MSFVRFDSHVTGLRPETVFAVSWSPDGRCLALACGSPDHGVTLIDRASLSEHERFGGMSAIAIDYSVDGALIAVARADDNTVCIVDVSTGRQRTLGEMILARAVAFSPDAKIVAASSLWGEVSVWNLADGSQQRIREGDEVDDDAVYCLAFSPDGRSLVAGQRSGGILRWSLGGFEPLDPLTGHEDIVMSLAFSSDRRFLASGAFDASVRLWDASTGGHLDTLRAPGRPGDSVVPAVAFSPDSRLLASAHPFQTTLLWDVHTRQIARRIDGYSVGSVISTGHMEFSPDGSTLAVATGEERVFFYDLGTEITRQISLFVDG